MENERILGGYMINIFLSTPTLQQFTDVLGGHSDFLGSEYVCIGLPGQSVHTFVRMVSVSVAAADCIRLPNSGKIIDNGGT